MKIEFEKQFGKGVDPWYDKAERWVKKKFKNPPNLPHEHTAQVGTRELICNEATSLSQRNFSVPYRGGFFAELINSHVGFVERIWPNKLINSHDGFVERRTLIK